MSYLAIARAVLRSHEPTSGQVEAENGLRTNELNELDEPDELSPPVVGPDLSERWGPGLTDDTPGIVIPRDWSWEVANWPQPLWAEWRAMVTEYLDNLGRPPEPDEIKAADYAAWCILRPETETAR